MKILILISSLLLSSCMSVTDFVKANDLFEAKLAPYKAAIEELNKRQNEANNAILAIDEKAGTKLFSKQEKQK